MLINLTPHSIAIYTHDTPDQIDPYTWRSPRIIPQAAYSLFGPVRLTESIQGEPWSVPVPVDPHTATVSSAPAYAPIYNVAYGVASPLPPQAEGVWYIVSLPAAMGLVYTLKRTDVLVPFREVRNMGGTVIGCRALARVM